MRWFIVLYCLATSYVTDAAEQDKPFWVGWIRYDYHARKPISFSATSSLTLHLFNISPAPIRTCPNMLYFDHVTFGPILSFPKLNAPPRTEEVWGAGGPGDEMEEINYEVYDAMRYGYFGIPRNPRGWPMSWALFEKSRMNTWKFYSRPGIELLQNEGYAMRLHFFPGWFDVSKLVVSKNVRKDFLAVNRTTGWNTALPKLVPGAVAPGKPVIWDEPWRTGGVNAKWVPLQADRKAPDIDPEDEIIIKEGLSARLELPEVIAGRDVLATYLVGNSSTQALWVWQSSLVAANATFYLQRAGSGPADQPLAVADGKPFKPLADLAPLRAPVLLHPGEYLSYRRPILAADVPVRGGSNYTFAFALDAEWSANEPSATTAPTISRVSATCPFRAVAAR